MEKIQEILAKVKKLSLSFDKDANAILRRLTDPDKSKLQLDLEVCQFYETIMQSCHHLCEVKCMILQMRHDLFLMKEQEKMDNGEEEKPKSSTPKKDKKKKNNEKDEKEKLIILVYKAEEAYEERKSETIKILEEIVEKSKKIKFTMQEMELWKEAEHFIVSNICRMNV